MVLKLAKVTIPLYSVLDIPQGYPRITDNPQLQNIQKGQKATMTCSAEAAGMERPTIYWLKDELPIDTEEGRIKVDANGNWDCCQTIIKYHFCPFC